MSVQQLNKSLDKALRDYIRKRNHILTGALYKSVLFNCSFVGGELKLKFSSMYYIKFLEYGDFVNDFYDLPSTNQIIRDFMVSYIETLI
jgi:hypothetical protein